MQGNFGDHFAVRLVLLSTKLILAAHDEITSELPEESRREDYQYKEQPRNRRSGIMRASNEIPTPKNIKGSQGCRECNDSHQRDAGLARLRAMGVLKG
jgi:hypothetical protein